MEYGHKIADVGNLETRFYVENSDMRVLKKMMIIALFSIFQLAGEVAVNDSKIVYGDIKLEIIIIPIVSMNINKRSVSLFELLDFILDSD